MAFPIMTSHLDRVAALRQRASMPRLFKVNWPGLAVVEAALMLPAACLLLARLPAICATAEAMSAAIPAMRIAAPGLVQQMSFWGAVVLIAAPPYLAALVLIDRLLTVRHGFAILSVLATGFWALAAAALAPVTAFWLPSAVAGLASASPGKWAALSTTAVSLLVHARPLRIGLADRGFVGLRLAVHAQSAHSNAATPNPRDRYVRSFRRGRVVLGWSVVFGVLMNAYIYRFQVISVWSNIAESLPQRGGISVPATITASANGVTLNVVLDANAPAPILCAADAERLGITPSARDYSNYVKVANALIPVAATRIDWLSAGAVTQSHVFSYIAKPGDLGISRLGKPFAG